MSLSFYSRLARRFEDPERRQSRREFLKRSMAASAALMLSNCAGLRGGKKGGPRVVVIGAGFSGLAAAFELKAAGYDVTVVESRNRVGGRALSFSDFIPGRNVEGGGELIGSNHPTWMAYGERFGLSFLDVSEDEDLEEVVVFGGRRLTGEEVEAMYASVDSAYGRMTDDARPVLEDEPWNTPNASALDLRSTASWLGGLEIDDLGRMAIKTELTANNGVSLENQSYLGNLTQVKGGGLEAYWTDSEVYRCAGGNQLLATRLAEAIGADQIRLSSPVQEIDMRNAVVRVRLLNGSWLEADDVILSVPPTVWGKILFRPSLPAGLNPQMGTSVKYLAAVSTRFWLEGGLSQYAFTDDTLNLTWEGTDAQSEGDGKFDLTSFSSADIANASRARSPEERTRAYTAAFEKVFPGFAESFLHSRFMDWPSDPWTLGAYSFPAPGQMTSIGPTLAAGLGKLHFAGEHCCYKFVGYMEGGLNSGASMAKAIATRDGMLRAVGS